MLTLHATATDVTSTATYVEPAAVAPVSDCYTSDTDAYTGHSRGRHMQLLMLVVQQAPDSVAKQPSGAPRTESALEHDKERMHGLIDQHGQQ